MSGAKQRREDALVTALSVTDTSRRVGWAKYFSAVEQADELAHDYNLSQSDVNILAECAGYLYGIVTGIAPDLAGNLPTHTYAMGALSMLPDRAIAAGRRIGAKRMKRSTRSRNGIGLANEDLVQFATELLEARRRERESATSDDEIVGRPVNISSSVSDRAPVEATPRRKGMILKHGKNNRIYLDEVEMSNLVKVSKIFLDVQRRVDQ